MEELKFEVDWDLVKKTTLWNYEDLIEKIRKVFSYTFIQKDYNHSMKVARDYVLGLLGYDPKYAEYISKLSTVFERLDDLNIRNYTELVLQVENREKCEKFLQQTEISFSDLISTLNYMFRWVLPFRNVYLRQLIDVSNEAHMGYIKKLREHTITFNLDILERGRTKKGRTKLSKETWIPETFILDLVNRADLTRLPYMSKKTVGHLCSAGYDTLGKLARVDVGKLKEDMKSYFEKEGIRLGSFIDLAGLVAWAKAVPKIVEI
ncbi:DUF4332 domain-containing protein [Candidatus Bathyarchaeota archaeon]|nr:DUF4332 domain-containing protein [Candidatus Bathyarchaeota archaeon]